MRFFSLAACLAVMSASACSADVFDWSSTEIQYLHGSGYKLPGGNRDGFSTFTVSHADGWSLGRNFFFMDTYIKEGTQASTVELYGEAYTYLSLRKLIGTEADFGIVKDIDLAGGVNLGEAMESNLSGVRIGLWGAAVEFNLPGFSLFTVDFLRHDQFEPTSAGTSWQITPVWKLPFTAFGGRWSFEGFADFIGKKPHGMARQALAQPQLRLDLGDFWGAPERLFVGIEYHYWHNKFGIKGLHDQVPQALLVWKF